MGNTCCSDEKSEHPSNDFRAARNEDNRRSELRGGNEGGGVYMEEQKMESGEGKNFPNDNGKQYTETQDPATLAREHAPTAQQASETHEMNPVGTEAQKRLDKLTPAQKPTNPEFNNLPNLGPYKYQFDSSTYRGQYNRGNREGFGEAVYTDGSIYQGSWMGDKRSGQGRMVYPDGSLYQGLWEQDKPHGRGQLMYEDGNGYDGNWDMGNIRGQGVQTWPDNTRYEGDFENGMKHGVGKFYWPDGNIYEGQYKNDLRDGTGVFSW